MINVLNLVIQEDTQDFIYPDEKIASNVYYVSLPNTIGSIAGYGDAVKKQKIDRNDWLKEKSASVQVTPVLDFDLIVKKLENSRCSCDALFYNTEPEGSEQHYLAEFKCADKAAVLKMMEDPGKDGIYQKVNDSVLMIQRELEFGGADEHEALTARLHFFLVYAGKNNVPDRNPVTMPGKMKVQKDGHGKQKSAGRMRFDSLKTENEIYERFGKQLELLGLASCSEDTFPGDALPRAIKRIKGGERVRCFTMFSASDFAEIVELGYFSNWKWGNYTPYFQCLSAG